MELGNNATVPISNASKTIGLLKFELLGRLREAYITKDLPDKINEYAKSIGYSILEIHIPREWSRYFSDMVNFEDLGENRVALATRYLSDLEEGGSRIFNRCNTAPLEGVIVQEYMPPAILQALQDLLPTVCLLYNPYTIANFGGETPWKQGIPTVKTDDRQLGSDAAQLLWNAGHRRIAVIGHIQGRFESFYGAWSRKLLHADWAQEVISRHQSLDILIPEHWNCQLSFHATYMHLKANTEVIKKELRDKNSNIPVTAIFCLGGESALAVLLYLKTIGIEVPNDISVLTVDRVPFQILDDYQRSYTKTGPLEAYEVDQGNFIRDYEINVKTFGSVKQMHITYFEQDWYLMSKMAVDLLLYRKQRYLNQSLANQEIVFTPHVRLTPHLRHPMGGSSIKQIEASDQERKIIR
jgi:hypothetical protein